MGEARDDMGFGGCIAKERKIKVADVCGLDDFSIWEGDI